MGDGKHVFVVVNLNTILRYNEICLHGCIIGSKFLFLGESVRDVVDLKLSMKYMAPTNILGIIVLLLWYYQYRYTKIHPAQLHYT